MKYSETKKLLNTAFKEKLKPYGFKRYKYGFDKIENDIYYRCGISVFNYDDFQQATFIFSIGIIPLTKILCAAHNESFDPKTSKPSHYPLSQAGLCDDKIFDSPDFTIYDENHIDNMVNIVMGFMDDRGFKILKEKSTIRGLEKYVNEDCVPMYRNNTNGLVLAKILDKEYYHKLVYEYGEEVKEWIDDNERDDYYKTEEFLKNHTREQIMEIAGLTENDLL